MKGREYMVEYRKARAEEAEDILDFINYVFSQAHNPHDFKQFNPGMYASGYPFWKEHYVAVENGRIKATLSITRKEFERAGMKFISGHVGQVSVHPYARGAGHMKKLMSMADEDMQADGWDFSELNGLRQRYEYFGYTQGDCRVRLTITPTNVRHALGGQESGYRAEKRPDGRLWESLWDVYDENGKYVGVAGNGTMRIEDFSIAPKVCDAFFRYSGEKSMTLSYPLYETERIRAVNAFCEEIAYKTGMQYKVYHFDRVIQAGLTLRAQAGLLQNGEMTIEIDGNPIRIAVKDSAVTVEKGEPGKGKQLTAMQAQEMIFSTASGVLYPEAPAGWFPISL